MTAQEIFNTRWPAVLAENPDHVRGIAAVCVFKVTGDGGGEWTVDMASAVPTCKAGVHGTAQCTLEIAHADLMSMLSNPAAGLQLYFAGKLKIQGDPRIATKAAVVALTVAHGPASGGAQLQNAQLQRLYSLISAGTHLRRPG